MHGSTVIEPVKAVPVIEHSPGENKGQARLSPGLLGAAARPSDRVVVEAGQIIPDDGEIIEGFACIDESAITGESTPVIREAGGDRSGVTGGTLVLSDRIIVQITARKGESFLARMIALAKTVRRS